MLHTLYGYLLGVGLKSDQVATVLLKKFQLWSPTSRGYSIWLVLAKTSMCSSYLQWVSDHKTFTYETVSIFWHISVHLLSSEEGPTNIVRHQSQINLFHLDCYLVVTWG